VKGAEPAVVGVAAFRGSAQGEFHDPVLCTEAGSAANCHSG
jgi:hypothetical protein